MRRLFIIRKDLNLSPGKLAAMVGHCAEGYGCTRRRPLPCRRLVQTFAR